jgi:hypothetical protein
MASILVLLPVSGTRVQYVLTCENQAEQWLYLANWLTKKGIGFALQSEYENPNSLKANQLYCVVKEGTVEGAYLLFNVLPTPDWESKEELAPNFTTLAGNLAWVLLSDKVDDKERNIAVVSIA